MNLPLTDIAPLVADELRPVLDGLGNRPANPFADIQKTRTDFQSLMAKITRPDNRTDVGSISVPREDGSSITSVVVRPAGVNRTLPSVLHIHGGGFSYGESAGPSPTATRIAAELGAVVIDVHYRLAPEHPFPAGPDDCFATYDWILNNFETLGIQPGNVAVVGASAGATLAASVALMARDRGIERPTMQCLLIPALDDRSETKFMQRIQDPRVTNGTTINAAWRSYLGDHQGRADLSPYAAPNRATDLAGLSPAFVLTCGLDPVRDEGLQYARRLAEAGVDVQTTTIPGAWHFFELNAPTSELARLHRTRWMTALGVGLLKGDTEGIAGAV